MDTSATSPPSNPITATVPWQKVNHPPAADFAQTLPPLNSGRIVTHQPISPARTAGLVLLLILLIVILIAGIFVTGSYTNWPKPYPWPALGQYATDNLLIRIPFAPKSSQIILRATLHQLANQPRLSHRLSLTTPQSSQPTKLNQDLVATTDFTNQTGYLSILTVLDSAENNHLQLQTDIHYSGSQTHIKVNQTAPHSLLDLTSFLNRSLILNSDSSSSLVTPDTAGKKTLSDIRKTKIKSTQTQIIKDWQATTTNVPGHDFATTHYLIEWQTTPQEFNQMLSLLLDAYRQTTSDVELSTMLDRIESHSQDIFQSNIQGNMLINKKDLFPEHVQVKTTVNLTLANNTQVVLPLEANYSLSPSGSLPPQPSFPDPLTLDRTLINQHIYSPFLKAIAIVLITP